MISQPQILPFDTEPMVPSIQDSSDSSPLVAPERSASADGNDGKSTSRPYRAKGKIASLPQDQRDQVNRMLLDGSTYKVVINAMKVHGVSLNYENVSNWHQGGHQEWLYDQEWREDTRALQESALETLGDIDHAKVNQAALHVATLQIFGALRHLKRGPLHEKLGGDSAAFARLVNALSRATREALNAQKIQDSRAQANLKRLDPNRKASEKERNVLLHHWRDFFGHDLSESDECQAAAVEGSGLCADFQSAVSPISNRHVADTSDAQGNVESRMTNDEGMKKSDYRNPNPEEIPNSNLRTPNSDPLRQCDSAARGIPNSELQSSNSERNGEENDPPSSDYGVASECQLPNDERITRSEGQNPKPEEIPNSELRTPNSETQESSIQHPASESTSPTPSLQNSNTPSPAPPSPPSLSENCLECGTALPPLRPDGGRPSKFCPVCCFPLPPPGCCVEPSIEQCPDCRANLPRLLPDGMRPLGHCLKCGMELGEFRMTKDG